MENLEFKNPHNTHRGYTYTEALEVLEKVNSEYVFSTDDPHFNPAQIKRDHSKTFGEFKVVLTPKEE